MLKTKKSQRFTESGNSVADSQMKEFEKLKAKIACICLPRLSAFNLDPQWE